MQTEENTKPDSTPNSTPKPLRYIVPVIDETEAVVRFGFRTVDFMVSDKLESYTDTDRSSDARSVVQRYYEELGSEHAGKITVGTALRIDEMQHAVNSLAGYADASFKVIAMEKAGAGEVYVLASPHPTMKQPARILPATATPPSANVGN